MTDRLRSPTSFTDVSGTWSTETNIYDNNDTTSATATSSVTVHEIDLTSFDFASVIPSDAVSIDGITVRVVQSCTNVARFAAPTVRAYNGTTALGTGVYTLGEYITLTSEDCALPGTFSVADVRSANFLITYIHQQTSTAGTPTAQIAELEVTVSYTPVNYNLTVNNASQHVTSGSPVLSTVKTLPVSNVYQNVQSAQVALKQNHKLVVQNGLQHVTSGVPLVRLNRSLIVGSRFQTVTSGSPLIRISKVLSINSSSQRPTSTTPTLAAGDIVILILSNGHQPLASNRVTIQGVMNYVPPVSTNWIVTTGTDLVTTDIKATLQLKSRFAGDTAAVDAVRFRALEKTSSESMLTSGAERMIISDITLATDYRIRPQLFHREYGGVYMYGGSGPVSIDSTAYPWKTVAFFAKPVSATTTLFKFGADEALVATDQGSGRWSINVPSGYTCYIGGASITDPQTVDFTMPRLIVLTNASLKTGIMYFGSTGGTGAVSSMSLNHVYVIPVALTAGQVTDFYKRFYGQQSLKIVDALGTSGSIASIRFVASNWTIGTVS
jgi:hypothetical protein